MGNDGFRIGFHTQLRGEAARDRNVAINCACAERKGNSPHTRVAFS